MTVSDLLKEIRFLTRTDTITFTSEDILAGLNRHNGEILNKILLTSGDWDLMGRKATKTLVDTTGLSEGENGFDGNYCYPTTMLRPIRVEIMTNGGYKKAVFYDIDQNDASEHKVKSVSNFLTSAPYVRFFGSRFVIRPLPKETVADGLVIWYEKRQGELVETITDKAIQTTTPEFEQNYHHLLTYMGALRYAERKPEKYNELWTKKAYGIEMDMLRWYSNKYNVQRSITPVRDNYS